MAGYSNRTITITIDGYTEPGDEMYITIRNPKLLSIDELNAGKPENAAEADEETRLRHGYAWLAGYITDWRVYDPETDRLLTLPATGEMFAKLPSGIQNKVADEVNKAANPTVTPDTPAS